MPVAVAERTPESLGRLLDAGLLFTPLAEEWSGEEITAEVSRTGQALLNDTSSGYLNVEPGSTWGSSRKGLLVTASGVVVSDISSEYVPDLLPFRIRRALEDSSLPLGKAVASLGGRREHLWSWRSGGGIALHVGARLWIPKRFGEVAVAMAFERVRAAWISWAATVPAR